MPFDAYGGLPANFDAPRIKPKPPDPPRKQPGSINRITRDLKLGIVDAATAYGSDGHGTGGLTGYLFMLAGSHPKTFAGLLGKLLPLQVNSQISSLVGEVKIVSVPSDTFLSSEDVNRLTTIEHEPATAPATATAADPGPGQAEPDPDESS